GLNGHWGEVTSKTETVATKTGWGGHVSWGSDDWSGSVSVGQWSGQQSWVGDSHGNEGGKDLVNYYPKLLSMSNDQHFNRNDERYVTEETRHLPRRISFWMIELIACSRRYLVSKVHLLYIRCTHLAQRNRDSRRRETSDAKLR